MVKMVRVALGALAIAGVSCSPMAQEPTLELTATPRTIRGDGQTSNITISAIDASGKPGTGSVRVRSTVGSLMVAQTLMLEGGAASTDFSCTAATEMGCRGSVRVTAEWTSAGKLVEGSVTLSISAPVVDGGTDGGTGDGGTPDAGAMDSGVPDAGTQLVLTADRPQIIAGIGQSATLTATLTSGGMAASGATIAWDTTGGTFVGSGDAGVCTTDPSGVCSVQLTAAAGATGNATVRATSTAPAATATQTIRIVSVSGLQFTNVSCAQTATNCNLMGIQGSGFNETAGVVFRVLDPSNMPVAGVAVSFQLIGAPSGTTVDPMQTSNAMGLVTATVRAGLTVGTFTVRATALGSLTVDSPTIGVRGAKPSNRGFTLQCSSVNISAYNSPTPPRPAQVTCNIGLTDRYNNPVGTGTAVRLNSEAGAVPNNVATAAFSPGSSSTEGRASFTFNTDQGIFPAVDVPPFSADTAQFPFQREAEPSIPNGPLTANPRDGLVTIIAYLQGEEDFKDNNNNGMWDTGEQYIDQGEPLLDSNDNNVWDVGEFYVDTNNNNSWDGPNGRWDSTTQIWTETRLLYTGLSVPSLGRISNDPSRPATQMSYGLIPIGMSRVYGVWAPDPRLNRITAGSSAAVTLMPSTRGSATLMSNTGLDGYGFELERRLLAGSGTTDCTPVTPRCTWFIRFGRWQEGFIGAVTLTGATTPPQMPTNQTVIITTTTDGVMGQFSANGTFD